MRREANRRRVLSLMAGAAAAGALEPARAAFGDLGAMAQKAGVLFGAALGSPYDGDRDYAGLFSQARLIVSEWQFKLASLAPDDGVYDFSNADRLATLAMAMRKPLKAHCLFWQAANPAWLKGLSTARLRYVFDAHIDRVVPRYAGKVFAWDVVNEPFWPASGLPGGFGDGPWYQAFGPDWPLRAFQRAAALDKTAKLALNEAECDINQDGLGNTIRPALLRLVDTIRQAGARLDAVGLESHLDMSQPYDDAMFGDFVARLAERGAGVWISELDVRDFGLPDDTGERDRLTGARVESFLNHALATRAVNQVATWGLSDKYSWLDEIWRREHAGSTRRPRPLPYDRDFKRKPMWSAMASAFVKRAPLVKANSAKPGSAGGGHP